MVSASALSPHNAQLELSNRNKLMDAAISCMETLPLNKITIQHIAEKSGIVRQTVYNYFHNKNDLLAATFEREGLYMAIAMADWIRPFQDLEEKFVQGFVFVVENFAKNPILAKVIEPGSDFLITVGMTHYPFSAFGQLAYKDVFAEYPHLQAQSEEISELMTRNAMSFLSMPGQYQRSREELASYVRRRLIPGLGLYAN